MAVSGSVPVTYSVLSDGTRGTDETVQMMTKLSMGIYGSRSTKIRALAINILTKAAVPEKQYEQEMVAIHNWVRDKIRYTRDVAGQETLLTPEETAFNSLAGDCDDKSILEAALLGSIGIPTRFVVVGVDQITFSHVYLQARPRTEWISLDPIMKDKPAGWEAPASRVKSRKVYPLNQSEEVHMNGNNLRGLQGAPLGYVGDPRVTSHLDPQQAPGRPAPAYVVMDSMLDQDGPMSQISRDMPAFPQQDVTQMRQPVARSIKPVLRNIANANGQARPANRSAAISVNQDSASEADIMNAAMNPLHGIGTDLMTPDKLQNVRSGIEFQRHEKNMQRPALAQTPEGVDVLFTRPNMISRFDKHDHVVFRGMYALNEKPPIRPYNGVDGMIGVQNGAGMPGMGALAGHSLSGPGVSDLADVANGSALPGMGYPGDALAGSDVPFYKNPLVLAAAAALGIYLYTRSKRK